MEKVVIVGAGLVGSLQAVYMAKKGFKVQVYERRPDMRKSKISAGRSINLALSDRGWRALERVGAAERIKKLAIPMAGRMMHSIDGELTFQPYGKEGQAIYSVSRGKLNEELMSAAEEHENVQIFFEHTCVDYDKEQNIIFFELPSGEVKEVVADHVFATDGAFSPIRSVLQKTERFDYSQHFLKHGYKELYIPSDENGGYKLDKNALHIWPRGNFMMIALANMDGSFTCTLFFPFEGDPSFESLDTKEKIHGFFSEVFPDSIKLMPDLLDYYSKNPVSTLVTIKCSPWHYKGNVMMLGDSSHAIVPFYGQGMNAGFEDCTLFDEIFEKNNRNWEKSFKEFSLARKEDADAIADLAIQNFIEMRDLVGDEMFLLRKKIEKEFSKRHPGKWMPLYSQVTFSHIPYSEALKQGKKQDAIMDRIMKLPDIKNIWNTELVEDEILKQLEND